jgi:hypothetical protein
VSSISGAPRSTMLHLDESLMFAAKAHTTRSSPTKHFAGTSTSFDQPWRSVRTVINMGRSR